MGGGGILLGAGSQGATAFSTGNCKRPSRNSVLGSISGNFASKPGEPLKCTQACVRGSSAPSAVQDRIIVTACRRVATVDGRQQYCICYHNKHTVLQFVMVTSWVLYGNTLGLLYHANFCSTLARISIKGGVTTPARCTEEATEPPSEAATNLHKGGGYPLELCKYNINVQKVIVQGGYPPLIVQL